MPSLKSLFLSAIMRKPTTPQILFLHGKTASGPLFSASTTHLQTHLSHLFPSTHHFPTAPNRLNHSSDTPGSYAWWTIDKSTADYVGLQETLRFLGNYLDFHGPFDGVIGFSQGAALAAMVCAALEGRELPRELSWSAEHPQMKFCVAMAGFRAGTGWVHDEFYQPRIRTPLLSVVGEEDKVVTRVASMDLERHVVDVTVESWAGGHEVPGENVMRNVAVWVEEAMRKAEEKRKKREKERW